MSVDVIRIGIRGPKPLWKHFNITEEYNSIVECLERAKQNPRIKTLDGDKDEVFYYEFEEGYKVHTSEGICYVEKTLNIECPTSAFPTLWTRYFSLMHTEVQNFCYIFNIHMNDVEIYVKNWYTGVDEP
mgnify:CR=1 FL=1